MDPDKIAGIIPPLVTPLTSRFELDSQALDRLVEHVIKGEVNGILLLGSTGESASLTDPLREQVIRAGTDAVSGRVPVLVNVTSPSYLETIRLAEAAAAAGADLIAVAPPYYFPMDQKELLHYLTGIADRSAIPLLLYNVPQYTKTAIEPATVLELAGHENIIGLKESSGDMDYLRALLAGRNDSRFCILAGSELTLFESLLQGCNGGINGGANLYPGLYVSLYRDAVRKDPGAMKKYQRLIERIDRDIYRVPVSPMGIVIGLKYLLSIRGICTSKMAMPVHGYLSPAQKRTFEDLDRELRASGY